MTGFRWEALPDGVLRQLAAGLELPEEEAAEKALRARFGQEPDEEFVANAWPVLLDSWLKTDKDSAGLIADRLRALGLGNAAVTGRSAAAVQRYLRTVKNSKTLREVALDTFLALGTSEEPLRNSLRVFVEQALRTVLRADDVTPDAQGEYQIVREGGVSLVCVLEEPPRVTISTRLLAGVRATRKLFETLNEINVSSAFVKAVLSDSGDVLLTIDLQGDGLRAQDLVFALDLLGYHAGRLDHDLAA